MRPYRKPVLTKHGDLRDITLAVGVKGKLDGGGSALKTYGPPRLQAGLSR